MTSTLLDGSSVDAAAQSGSGVLASFGPKRAWCLLLQLADRLRAGGEISTPIGVALDAEDHLVEVPIERATVVLDPAQSRGWSVPEALEPELPPASCDLLDLFVPLCVGADAPSLVVAHLAQSLDGRVATASGSSKFISGREDLTHTHRLRAMFDAVLVGARTIEHDDPRLTTRLAPGPNPTRVIVDPTGRLPNTHHVFTEPDASTVLVRGPGRFDAPAHVDVVELELEDGWIPAPVLLEALAERGLRRVFVEGGGITVSGFMKAGVLDRLHITVAPVLMGSGRPSLRLPEIATLDEAMRISCRHFTLGPDVLFDCPLRGTKG
ncbi:MAG: RibD family protein [Nannocystales bacterium]